MLDVSGLVVIPKDPQYREVQTNAGFYLDFMVISQDRDMNNELVYHRYRANMWVPGKEIDTWRDKLQPGQVLKFAAGQWSATQKEESKFPINILKLDSRRVTPLKTPMWYSDS